MASVLREDGYGGSHRECRLWELLVTPRCDTEDAGSGARRSDRLCSPRAQRENLPTKTLDTNTEYAAL